MSQLLLSCSGYKVVMAFYLTDISNWTEQKELVVIFPLIVKSGALDSFTQSLLLITAAVSVLLSCSWC